MARYQSLLEGFLKQKHEWAMNGQEPDTVTWEMRYCLEEQEKRLRRKGLTLDERHEFREGDIVSNLKRGNGLAPIRNYTAYRETRRFREFSSSGRTLYKDSLPVIVYANVTDRDGVRDYPVNCPNCGGVTMASELMQGCPYCGTYFVMSDLFPRVNSYYAVEQPMDRYKADERLKKTFGTIGAVLAAIGFALYMWQGKDYVLWFRILYSAFFGGFLAAILTLVCYLAYSGFLLLKLFGMAGKSLAMLPSISGRKKLAQKMEELEPGFSMEMFEGRILSKLQTVLFSDDRDSLNLYEGIDDLSRFDDLVNMDYRGAFNLKHFSVSGGRVCLELEFFTENWYMKQNRLRHRNERMEVTVERSAGAVQDPGFTATAVQCPGCGRSFDAMHKKECPYCGNTYRLGENDWLITGIRKR